MTTNDRAVREFFAKDSMRRQVAAVFETAGFRVSLVHEEPAQAGAHWSLNLKLSSQLKNMLGTTREVLVNAVQSAEFQPRDVHGALAIIDEERLCEDFCFVLTHDPETGIHAQEASESSATAVLGYSFAQLVEQFKPHGRKDFVSELRRKLYARDLYNVRSAVTRKHDFFGRKAFTQELTKNLVEDGVHVGVFGLRKVGKTSLLNKLVSNIRSGQSAYVAHVDVEKIDAISAGADRLLWSLGEAIFDSHKNVRLISNFLMFGQYPIFSRVPSAESVAELFNHDMKLVLMNIKKPLILILDEIERMNGREWNDGFVRVFRLLRGIDQETPGKLRFFVTGTNPSLFEKNKINDEDNPAFNYFTTRYLQSLDHSDTSDLLTQIGRRMGIEWTDDGILRVFQATGGHPALLRAFGSLVHRTRPEEAFACRIDKKAAELLFPKFLLDESPLLSQLTAVLSDQYPNEAFLLDLLAAGRIVEFHQFVETFPEDVAHLVGYGLCEDPTTSRGVSVELLHTFLQGRIGVREAGTIAPPPGQLKQVGPYELGGVIGRPGGFAHVYEGKRISDQLGVAVKVFDRGSISALEREIEPLAAIKHPAVVEVLDYGQTESGVVYMVMNRLHGDSLRQFCKRTSRADIEDVLAWTKALLLALKAIHPDILKIEYFQRKRELTEGEAEQLHAARHGFIHRDIKPENIVLTPEGPVLIDFNISVHAASPVRTVSATPGYLPDGNIGVTWTPTIDLFQLGLTMLQVATGFDLSHMNKNELRNNAAAVVEPTVARYFLKMCEEEESKRFQSAENALASLRVVMEATRQR